MDRCASRDVCVICTQILHETDDSISPAILRAVYEIHGSDVLEQ